MPEPEQIRPYGPGRFATMVDAYVYELAQEGFTDEFTTTDGAWLGLLKATARTPLFDPAFTSETQLNDAERRFLTPKAGVILEEDSTGSLTMDYYDRIEDMDAAWEALKPRAEVALETDMDNAFLEIPEASPNLQLNDDMLNTAEDQGYQDAREGTATKGSTPSMARYDSWAKAWGYRQETHTDELGFLTEAWRRGVYRYVADQAPQVHRRAASFFRKASGSTDIAKTLNHVVATLTNGSIPSLVVGGYAVQEHGYPRFTQDVDVVVPDVAAAREFLSIRGFKPNPGSSMTLTDRETKVEVDLLPGGGHVGPGTVPLPMPSEVSGGPHVVDLPTLLSLKLSSYQGSPVARAKDYGDVVELLKANHPPRDLAVDPTVQDLYEKTWDSLFPG